MPSLNVFLRKWLGYKFKKLEYTFLEEIPLLPTPIHKEKFKNSPETLAVFRSIKEAFNPRYLRDSYEGNQKEKVKISWIKKKIIFLFEVMII